MQLHCCRCCINTITLSLLYIVYFFLSFFHSKRDTVRFPEPSNGERKAWHRRTHGVSLPVLLTTREAPPRTTLATPASGASCMTCGCSLGFWIPMKDLCGGREKFEGRDVSPEVCKASLEHPAMS